jgi:hypothetical protein
MKIIVTGRYGFGGDLYGNEPVALPTLLDDLKAAQQRLLYWPVDRIIEVLDDFSTRLLERRCDLPKRFPQSGISFIAHFCRSSNLKSLLDVSLGSRQLLDRFLPKDPQGERTYLAFPRGLAVHWMAGNVPTLGFLSLIQGLLTKNANLIKLASGSDDLLPALLDFMARGKVGQDKNGRDLVRASAVIQYDHNRQDIGSFISERADVRVMWGSDESVRQMRALPSKLDVVDVVFPNRTAFMVIGQSVLKEMDMPKIARRLANDISVFEQKACASPHTLFLETENDEEVSRLATNLQQALQEALRRLPKTTPSQKEISALLNLRARYDMFHRAWYSEGTEFTILSDDLFQLGPPIGNRTIYLRKVANLERLAELVTPQVQSVGLLVDGTQFEFITGLLAAAGVQRFVPLGSMTNFESPWDGYFLPQHLVRWISRTRFSL